MCHCGAVVKELLERADKPGSTPDDVVFCFFVLFFSLFSLSFFNTIFPFGLFFFVLNADPAGYALGSIYILSLSPEFYFGKGISKALDLHTGQAYDQKKTHKPSRHAPPLKQLNFFQCLDIMTNNTQYTINCTNLHPTPTSDPLAKVKLAFLCIVLTINIITLKSPLGLPPPPPPPPPPKKKKKIQRNSLFVFGI